MGLVTIDPHSHKVHTKLYQIRAFKNAKIYKEMYGLLDAV